jgi:hypothetical protein
MRVELRASQPHVSAEYPRVPKSAITGGRPRLIVDNCGLAHRRSTRLTGAVAAAFPNSPYGFDFFLLFITQFIAMCTRQLVRPGWGDMDIQDGHLDAVAELGVAHYGNGWAHDTLPSSKNREPPYGAHRILTNYVYSFLLHVVHEQYLTKLLY